MQRKSKPIIDRQERRKAKHMRNYEKSCRMIAHVQETFKNVLESAGLQVFSGKETEAGLIIVDAQGLRFSLQTMIFKSGPVVKVHKSRTADDSLSSLMYRPFFSWTYMKEPRPRKAALLLAKKIQLNPMYEVMET